MELTQSEVLDKLYAFLCHARRVQEIKDSLVYFQSFGDEETVRKELAGQDELIHQIHEIYHGQMVPLVEEIAAFLQAHPEDVGDLMEAEEEQPAGEV